MLGPKNLFAIGEADPIERLPPGAYESRVTLTDGTDAEARTADLAIGE